MKFEIYSLTAIGFMATQSTANDAYDQGVHVWINASGDLEMESTLQKLTGRLNFGGYGQVVAITDAPIENVSQYTLHSIQDMDEVP